MKLAKIAMGIFFLTMPITSIAQGLPSPDGGISGGTGQVPCRDDAGPPSPLQPPVGTGKTTAGPYTTAFNYYIVFYPRWYSYWQAAGPCNTLTAPDRISPVYQVVVAINDDTLYGNGFMGVKKEPVIVTVPPSKNLVYSIEQLDGYGNAFKGIPPQAGIYGLTGPGWQGVLPPEVIQVPVPVDYSVFAVRADKFTCTDQKTCTDMTAEGEAFRVGMHAAYLSKYLQDHNAGQLQVVPEKNYSFPFKTIAYKTIQNNPIGFLKMLQIAVHGSTTQPKTSQEQQLSDDFDALFSDQNNYPDLIAGAQAAHDATDANYLTHTFAGTNWVLFTNIGAWNNTDPQTYLDRASVTDYLEYSNVFSSAYYYQAFRDGNGAVLDGSAHSYTLKFPPNGFPSQHRFFSLTAYLPISIELIPNDTNKYLVANYTPNLQYDADGSLTITMATTLPPGVPEANWLPIRNGEFNVVLRVYGPTQGMTYIPPAIVSGPPPGK